ncbi:unnamed protein product [Bemisia tabaci]|uniref:Enoyl reductase (ER) domain-containing protein n=1 Tax=Bemisia tabaci TaxID=7038 RepID=A0A9P0AE52_BEMTA|nr:unnamed protein product [Bemisia tabaci]
MNEHHLETSKSICLTGYGGFDKIQVQNVMLPPALGTNEVKVQNKLFGVNFADLYTLKGLFEFPLPHTLGLESVGRVLEVGAGVKDVKAGDRVVCYKWTGGLYSEFINIDMKNCFVIPPSISDEDAATLPANYLTAYITLFKIAKLQADQSVLIHSCAGGVGWAATQLAKLFSNVTILGTASESKFKMVVENGVNRPLTYENYATIISQSEGEVDCIIDSIGGSNFSISQKLLKPLGHAVLTGCSSLITGPEIFTSSEREALSSSTVPDMQGLVMGSRSISGFHLGLLMDQNPQLIRNSMESIFKLLGDGKIKPRIDSIWSFHEVVQAISLLEKRKNIGKVLLKI